MRTCRGCGFEGQLDLNFSRKQEFQKMLFMQDYECAICHNEFEYQEQIKVDHDHETGAVRGLLCSLCNTGLGQFRDRLDLLEAAVAYLRLASRD